MSIDEDDFDRDDADDEERSDCHRCGSTVDVSECDGCWIALCRRCWSTHDEKACVADDEE